MTAKSVTTPIPEPVKKERLQRPTPLEAETQVQGFLAKKFPTLKPEQAKEYGSAVVSYFIDAKLLRIKKEHGAVIPTMFNFFRAAGMEKKGVTPNFTMTPDQIKERFGKWSNDNTAIVEEASLKTTANVFIRDKAGIHAVISESQHKAFMKVIEPQYKALKPKEEKE